MLQNLTVALNDDIPYSLRQPDEGVVALASACLTVLERGCVLACLGPSPNPNSPGLAVVKLSLKYFHIKKISGLVGSHSLSRKAGTRGIGRGVAQKHFTRFRQESEEAMMFGAGEEEEEMGTTSQAEWDALMARLEAVSVN